jgi:hypothetical protein
MTRQVPEPAYPSAGVCKIVTLKFAVPQRNIFCLPPLPHHPMIMQENNLQAQSWPDLAIGLYDKLTGRGAEITYEFHNLELHVPESASPGAAHALWKVSGTVKIRTRDESVGASSRG